MSEDNNAHQQSGSTTQDGNSGAGQDNNQNQQQEQQQTQNIDLTNLSSEQLEQIFNGKQIWTHDRFKDLADAKQKLSKLEQQQSEADKKKMEEQGQFKELVEKTQSELEAANNTIKDLRINQSPVSTHDP